MNEKRIIDWDALEPHYRAGIRSLKDIGNEFGVSDAAIIKKAKREGWDRNLKAKIQAKADAKVSAAVVSAEVSEERKLTENVRIEIESEVQARIRLGHRKDIARSRNVAMELLGEIEAQTINAQLFEELGEMLRSNDDRGVDKRNDLYMKVISSSGRIDSMKKLSDTLKTLIGLEREAYGLIEETKEPVSITNNATYSISPEEYQERAKQLLKEV